MNISCFFHLVLWLVLRAVDVLDFASPNVPPGANTLGLADDARILDSSWFAGLCFVAFDQTLCDQLVARNLKVVEVPNADTALEEASILGTDSCKLAHFLPATEFIKGFV